MAGCQPGGEAGTDTCRCEAVLGIPHFLPFCALPIWVPALGRDREADQPVRLQFLERRTPPAPGDGGALHGKEEGGEGSSALGGLSHVSIRWVTLGLAAVLLLTSALRKWQAPQATPEPIPALADDTFTFYLNHSVYRSLYPHLQLYRCQEVIAPDGLCQGPSGVPLLLLAIKSHLASTGSRATLRRTWAQAAEVGGFRLQPLFLLGATSKQKQLELVAQESRMFGDILMWTFVESHSNLSLKERCFLQWVHGHCQRAAFVFKGEDDVFVNPVALTKFLRQTPNASHFIHGHIHYHPAVKRIGRDAIPFLLFPLAHYPHFALEKGFLVPGAALPALYQASLWLPTFPLSGAYWGFLALAVQLPHKHSGDFRAWEKMQDHLTFYQKSLVVHGVPMERMEAVWQELRGSAWGWPK